MIKYDLGIDDVELALLMEAVAKLQARRPAEMGDERWDRLTKLKQTLQEAYDGSINRRDPTQHE